MNEKDQLLKEAEEIISDGNWAALGKKGLERAINWLVRYSKLRVSAEEQRRELHESSPTGVMFVLGAIGEEEE